MDTLEIKQGSFIQQTQYFIPMEINLSIVERKYQYLKYKNKNHVKIIDINLAPNLNLSFVQNTIADLI
jgi:hypothetical protein